VRKWLLLLFSLLLVALLVVLLQIGSWLIGGRVLPTPTLRTPAAVVTLPPTQAVPGLNATGAIEASPTVTSGVSQTVISSTWTVTQPAGSAAPTRAGVATITPWPTNTHQP
jgi:hypothetical protein